MDFVELTIDSLIHNGALSSAIPEMDLGNIRSLSPQPDIQEGSTPNLPIMVANRQLQIPNGTIELKFEVGDIEFHEIFIVMENLTGPLIGVWVLQKNHTVLEMRQGIYTSHSFRCCSRQLIIATLTSLRLYSIRLKSPFHRTIES